MHATHAVCSDPYWETDTQSIIGQVPEPEQIGCEGKTGSAQGMEADIAARQSKQPGEGIQGGTALDSAPKAFLEARMPGPVGASSPGQVSGPSLGSWEFRESREEGYLGQMRHGSTYRGQSLVRAGMFTASIQCRGRTSSPVCPQY